MNDASLLRQPAARAVRAIALSLLEDARGAAKRLRDREQGEDGQALHDFRVTVRRLHSWLRAWDPRFADSVMRKTRRRVRRIARATGPARDAEVHLAWLRTQRRALSGRRRAGIDWTIRAIESRRKSALDDAVGAARAFCALQAKLSRQLHRYTLRLHPGSASDDDPFGVALAGVLRRQAVTLRRRLAAVHEYTDEAEAHRARIAARRLRYLLEPVAHDDDESAALIDSLATLQDLLGNLHDVHVFSRELAAASAAAAAEQQLRVTQAVTEGAPESELRRLRAADPGPGQLALARLLRRRGLAAFEAVRAEWLGDASASFFERLRAHAARLARASEA